MRNLAALALAASLLASSTASADSRKTWGTVSDAGAAGLAVLALGVPLYYDDTKGLEQSAASMAIGAGLAEGLSAGIREERPDGRGRDSFPSSHAALAFAAAATLHNRYGWGWGLPATAVATVVAVGRVESRRHHWYDALAGAAIGEASGFLITHKYDRDVHLVPWADSSGGGFSLAARF